MTPRFLVLNGVRLVLLLVFVVTPSRTVQGLCLLGLLATLVVDIVFYRRDKALEPAEDESLHVPMPPDRTPRER